MSEPDSNENVVIDVQGLSKRYSGATTDALDGLTFVHEAAGQRPSLRLVAPPDQQHPGARL